MFRVIFFFPRFMLPSGFRVVRSVKDALKARSTRFMQASAEGWRASPVMESMPTAETTIKCDICRINSDKTTPLAELNAAFSALQ